MCVIPQEIIDQKLDSYDAQGLRQAVEDKDRLVAAYLDATQPVPEFYTDKNNKLVPATPEFHLFCGAPGTGKTTLAKTLTETYAQNIVYKHKAHEFGMVAFDHEEIMKQMDMYQNIVGEPDSDGLSPQATGETRVKAYGYTHNAACYVSESIANAMFLNRRNFMYSIDSADENADQLVINAKEAGYKVIVHVCEAPSYVYEQAVHDRFLSGGHFTPLLELIESPAKSRSNMIELLALADRGHLYYRTEADTPLKQVAVFSNHMMGVESTDSELLTYKAFVGSTGHDYDSFIPSIRKTAGLDREPAVAQTIDMDCGFSARKYGW